MRILVTGAGGFVGRHLCQSLKSSGHAVRAVVRRKQASTFPADELIQVSDLASDEIESTLFSGCDGVVHLAGRAHILKEAIGDPLAAFRRMNLDATLRLAREAGKAGVKRFVFVSSIGAIGNKTHEEPFSESTPTAPQEDYAISKLEAEDSLKSFCAESGMEYVIIRPPLVYGPDAPGNFGLLLKLLATGAPLPFGSIESRRSLISVWNLADFIKTCMEHPSAANQTFVVADREEVTLAEIFRHLAQGFGRKNWIFPCPTVLLSVFAWLAGKQAAFEKLVSELRVESEKAKALLGWNPPSPAAEDLRRTGGEFAAMLAARTKTGRRSR